MGSFVLKLRRGETPFYRRLKKIAHNVRASNLPLPRFFNPVLRLGFHIVSSPVESGSSAGRWLTSSLSHCFGDVASRWVNGSAAPVCLG